MTLIRAEFEVRLSLHLAIEPPFAAFTGLSLVGQIA